jgi:hypothetical protein
MKNKLLILIPLLLQLQSCIVVGGTWGGGGGMTFGLIPLLLIIAFIIYRLFRRRY